MPRPLKRRPLTVARVPSTGTRKPAVKACHPSELDGRESKALAHHRAAAMAAVPELSPEEYALIMAADGVSADGRTALAANVMRRAREEADRIVQARARALREKARELAGVGYEAE